MKKNLKKNLKKFAVKNKYLVAFVALGVGFTLLMGVASVKANASFWDKVAQYVGFSIAEKIDVPNLDEIEPSFGAVVGPYIFEKWHFYDGFIPASPINIPLRQSATTSSSGTNEFATSTAGYYCNPDADMWVKKWWWEIETANGNWQSQWRIGTTTCDGYDGTACVGLNNTTTATLMGDSGLDGATNIASSTTGVYDPETAYLGKSMGVSDMPDLGSYYGAGPTIGNGTTTPFLLQVGDCIVIYGDQNGATSSNSYTDSGGGGAFRGTFHADVVYR